MSDYLKEKNIKLINDGKFILIEKDGVETKYRISITSLSLKQCLIRNLMILLESKDRDFIKGVVDSWYKKFKTTKEPPSIQIEKKESVSMDFSVVLKAFDDFKEGLLKSKDEEIKQLKELIEEDREDYGGWIAKQKEKEDKEKEKADKMVEEHVWFIEKDGVETRYRISITSLSLKQCLIRNLMILLESKDRDFIKGVVDSWYKKFKTTKEPPSIQIEKKESVSMDISVVLKAFDDFKEGLMKSKDEEIKQLKEEIQEDSEAWGDWVGKEKEKTAKMEETHLRFIEEWRKEKEDWRKEKEDWLDQVVNLQEEVEGLKERNEELVEENKILKEDNLELMTKELID